MKNYLIILIIITGLNPLIAQQVHTKNISATDERSQHLYDDINRNNRDINAAALSNLGLVNGFSSVIALQKDELSDISPSLIQERVYLKNFISGSSFNAVNGYNSYGYIQKRYPLNPIYLSRPSVLVRNKIIRYRFEKKLLSESDRIGDYLNTMNPITEGERVLLMLTTLENVINIVLPNEEY